MPRVSGGELTDAGPGPMSWLNAQVRAGALEFQSPDLAQVLGRPAESMLDRLRDRHA
ncbi:hypothetical protein [Nonomuraea jabiensis]|uniref:hypothetical protein n=1 Tax=Nonomuraea jabiensis TaxID=882448 RepID=UPI003D734CA4